MQICSSHEAMQPKYKTSRYTQCHTYGCASLAWTCMRNTYVQKRAGQLGKGVIRVRSKGIYAKNKVHTIDILDKHHTVVVCKPGMNVYEKYLCAKMHKVKRRVIRLRTRSVCVKNKVHTIDVLHTHQSLVLSSYCRGAGNESSPVKNCRISIWGGYDW